MVVWRSAEIFVKPEKYASGPVHTYQDIFESATFFFPDTASVGPHAFGESGYFLNPPFRVEKYNSWTNPITCGRVNPDIFKSDDLANLCPVSYRTVNQYGGTTANKAYLPRLSRALWRMLWTRFIAEEPWGPEWIWIPSDGFGRANSIWKRYV